MKAIEIKSKTDKAGHLRIDYKLSKPEKNVRVIILLEDDSSDQDEEKVWMQSISSNPAFDYLEDPREDIYTLKDGEAFND